MSRRGDCFDNAVMESFFATLKGELAERFGTVDEAKTALFDYIEVFYNQRRRQSTLGQISPAAFERRPVQAALSICPHNRVNSNLFRGSRSDESREHAKPGGVETARPPGATSPMSIREERDQISQRSRAGAFLAIASMRWVKSVKVRRRSFDC